MEVRIIEYKDKKILYVDNRGATSEEDIVDTGQQGIKLRKESSGIAGVLVDCTGVNQVFSKTYINRLREGLDKDSKEKIAIIGITGIDKAMVRGVGAVIRRNHVRLFDAETEGLEWLVNETDE